ncbi:MAG: TIGR01212 family radical SAM protein [Spirochaetes bacterium]|nr:TIGR01212 family radical SAM protein [Spirochaetota bacterium]
MKNADPSRSPATPVRPYNFFGDYLIGKHGCRVLKIPIDAGFSCPNRDGTVGTEGCIFCAEDGSASPASDRRKSIGNQIDLVKRSFRRSDRGTRYIAYFQAFTNTYGTPEELRRAYDEAIAAEGIIGLMVGTRPDCLADPVLDLLASYRRDGFELWLEIGMQTMHDRSLLFLQRGHDHAATRDAARRASLRGIPVCMHIILGIPGESWSDMMETASELNALAVSGAKIHHLHVIRGTALAALYREGAAPPLSQKEYVSVLCDFLERLDPGIVIHRILGDREPSTLVAPLWGIHKGTVIKAVEDEFLRRGTAQGYLHRQS